MRKDNTIEAFFALVRGGLWETEVQLASYGKFDYENILRIAREQSVVGLVAAGLEHITDVIVPQVIALQFAGETLQLEQRNKAMNVFLARLISNFRYEGINAILVKGQGIAQCYERPLWRSSGDVDLLLDSVNFVKAQQYLMPISIRNEGELKEEKQSKQGPDKTDRKEEIKKGAQKRVVQRQNEQNVHKEPIKGGTVKKIGNMPYSF